jgi:hypothetical protein
MPCIPIRLITYKAKKTVSPRHAMLLLSSVQFLDLVHQIVNTEEGKVVLLDAAQWLASRLGLFTTGPHLTGGWVGPRAGLDDME